MYDLAPATRPAAWPAECGLTSIFAGWAQAGLCTGRRSLWSAALLPGDPLLPVGADQRGALAGGETSVGAGARLWRLRGQGSVRARARWRGSVRARWTSRHGRGQEEGDHDGEDDDDDEGALLRFIFLPLSYLAPRLRIGYFGGSQAAHPHDYPGTTET